jgi:hypothetical protein
MMDLLHNTQNSPNKIKRSAAAEVGSAILEFNKIEIWHSKAITDNGQNTGFQHHAFSGNHNTWCGKLTSFFELSISYLKGS